jgi:hypothetical protein
VLNDSESSLRSAGPDSHPHDGRLIPAIGVRRRRDYTLSADTLPASV